MNRNEEIAKVKQLGKEIGYGNLMDIASGLWAIEEKSPMHIPTVVCDMTEKGKKDAMYQLEFRIEELKKLGY